MSDAGRSRDLDAGYEDFQALFGVSLDLAAGETVALVGANGAGKTTLLMTIAGALRPWRGRITLDGADVTGQPDYQRARSGVVLVPEGRRLFASLTAEENILVPAGRRDAGPWTLDALYELFPMVAARRSHRAALLSGGEQQAVAIARALAANPRVLLLDEVSLGPGPGRGGRLLPAAAADPGVRGVHPAGRAGHRPGAGGQLADAVPAGGAGGAWPGERLAGPRRRSSPPTSARQPRHPALGPAPAPIPDRDAGMTWVNDVLQGIFLGGAYALTAVGLSLMFGVMRWSTWPTATSPCAAPTWPPR